MGDPKCDHAPDVDGCLECFAAEQSEAMLRHEAAKVPDKVELLFWCPTCEGDGCDMCEGTGVRAVCPQQILPPRKGEHG